jgi:hypothetical protein
VVRFVGLPARNHPLGNLNRASCRK